MRPLDWLSMLGFALLGYWAGLERGRQDHLPEIREARVLNAQAKLAIDRCLEALPELRSRIVYTNDKSKGGRGGE